jgi:TRAP-type C4-dicarboxylate transport system substrate-binding protein
MNLRTWQALSASDREAVTASARESAAYQRILWKEEVTRVLSELEGKGVHITREVDKEPFRKAVLPLYESLDPDRKRWVERIRGVE